MAGDAASARREFLLEKSLFGQAGIYRARSTWLQGFAELTQAGLQEGLAEALQVPLLLPTEHSAGHHLLLQLWEEEQPLPSEFHHWEHQQGQCKHSDSTASFCSHPAHLTRGILELCCFSSGSFGLFLCYPK